MLYIQIFFDLDTLEKDQEPCGNRQKWEIHRIKNSSCFSFMQFKLKYFWRNYWRNDYSLCSIQCAIYFRVESKGYNANCNCNKKINSSLYQTSPNLIRFWYLIRVRPSCDNKIALTRLSIRFYKTPSGVSWQEIDSTSFNYRRRFFRTNILGQDLITEQWCCLSSMALRQLILSTWCCYTATARWLVFF